MEKYFTSLDASIHWRGQDWSVRIVSILVGALGLVNLFSATIPAQPVQAALLKPYVPLLVRHGGHLTSALAGFALILLAFNLWRHKQTAWLVTEIVLVASIIVHLVKGLDVEEALLSAAVAAWLYVLRPHFHARSDLPSIKQGLVITAIAILFTLLYGIIGFDLLDRHFKVDYDLAGAVIQTVVMFTQFYDPGYVPLTGFGRYFAASIYAIGAITLGYGLLMLLTPVLIRQPATPDERRRAAAIVTQYGRSSLARLTLLDDKSYYFSPGGSLVAFVQKQRTAIALGDPIGPAEDFEATLAGYKEFCSRNDWIPAFYQTGSDTLEAYRRAGFHAVCVGMEGLVDLKAFTTEGKAGKDLRATLNRMNRSGTSFKIYQPPIDTALLRELRQISDEWLTMMHGTEYRFSVGWFDNEYIRSGPVAVVQTAGGAISAFANIIPEYQRNEATLDLMRRRKEIEPGTMDFLFISLFVWAKQQGYNTFSLGLSALSGVGEKSEDPAVERAMHYIYENIDQFYNFKGLHAFKDKFHPQWEPRYLIYPASISLASAWLAVVSANAASGLLKQKGEPAASPPAGS